MNFDQWPYNSIIISWQLSSVCRWGHSKIPQSEQWWNWLPCVDSGTPLFKTVRRHEENFHVQKVTLYHSGHLNDIVMTSICHRSRMWASLCKYWNFTISKRTKTCGRLPSVNVDTPYIKKSWRRISCGDFESQQLKISIRHWEDFHV